MTLTKSGIIKKIAKEIGITQKKASVVLSVLLHTIESELVNKGKFTIRNFGKFYMTTMKPRNIIHPQTGQIFKAKKKNLIKFKCAKSIENDMNIVEWPCTSSHNSNILQQIYDLIEDTEIEGEDEDEAMYYPGKLGRY